MGSIYDNGPLQGLWEPIGVWLTLLMMFTFHSATQVDIQHIHFLGFSFTEVYAEEEKQLKLKGNIHTLTYDLSNHETMLLEMTG